ncbi:MAG: DUF5610 domain-containing protein [Sulfuriflexus sp.]|nr:DUF5610 domain-containing protein [Sulfuriflexus sp.]
MTITPVETQATPQATPPISVAQQQKASLNASILKSTEVSLSAQDNPLALTLRAIIDELNTALEPEIGPNAIDAAVESGLDVSPEATAERIVNLSTAFFSSFQDSNPDESGDEVLTHFLDVIRGGIEQGFTEARNILEGLAVLEGSIASNIDLTYELVQEKLDAFQLKNSDTQATE